MRRGLRPPLFFGMGEAAAAAGRRKFRIETGGGAGKCRLSVDKWEEEGSIAALLLELVACRGGFRRVPIFFHAYVETHLSALQADPQAAAWIPRPHGFQRWPDDAGPPPSEGPQAPVAEGCRDSLCPSHAILTEVRLGWRLPAGS